MSVFRLSGENALEELKRRVGRPSRQRMRVVEVMADAVARLDEVWPSEEARERGRVRVPAIVKALCREHGIPDPECEYAFHPRRKWRADYAWVQEKILLEIDGGIWTHGRHVTGAGFLADCEKLNTATLLGYRILRYTPDKLSDAIASVRLLLLGGE